MLLPFASMAAGYMAAGGGEWTVGDRGVALMNMNKADDSRLYLPSYPKPEAERLAILLLAH